MSWPQASRVVLRCRWVNYEASRGKTQAKTLKFIFGNSCDLAMIFY